MVRISSIIALSAACILAVSARPAKHSPKPFTLPVRKRSHGTFKQSVIGDHKRLTMLSSTSVKGPAITATNDFTYYTIPISVGTPATTDIEMAFDTSTPYAILVNFNEEGSSTCQNLGAGVVISSDVDTALVSLYSDDFSFGPYNFQQVFGAGIIDGGINVMGFGPSAQDVGTSGHDQFPSVMDNLVANNMVPSNVVGLDFRPIWNSSVSAVNGEIDFGWVDHTKYTGNIAYAPLATDTNHAGNWEFKIPSIQIGGNIVMTDVTAILDAGVAMMWVSPQVMDSLFGTFPGGQVDPITKLFTIPNGKVHLLEPITFTIGGSSITWSPSQYMITAQQAADYALSSNVHYLNIGQSQQQNLPIAFDIPELDAMICGKLSRRDLARCSLVSKQWHQTVIPYLWKDISHINDYSFNKHYSFRQIVLEDYLQQKRPHTQSEDHPSSTLAKHCRWIKVFPSADQLLECLKPPENDTLHTQGDLEEHKTDPTAGDLMRHILDRCSDIVVPFLTLSDLKLSPYDYPDMLEIVVKYFLPRAQSLEIERWDGISNIGPSFEPQKIKFLLSQCSSHLKVLSLSDLADIEYGEYGIPAEEYATEDEYELDWSEEEFEDEYEPDWSGEEFEEESESNKNEDNSEKGDRMLHLGSIINNVDALVKGISDHMPNIRNIKFGLEIEEQSSPTNRCISNILSGCTGLRSMEVRPSAGFRGASKSALVKHYGTLQDLVVPSVDYESEELVALLSSTPKLRALITMYDGDYMFGPVAH
ncbi:hypothetical protein BGZ46_009861 [Entomortierella lignicola]|nr:hypothetical protein BGZ46_009861 [Entomortierella lignicola]